MATTTTNLEIDYLIANTVSPEIVINEALDDIDNLSGMFTHNMITDADYTLSINVNSPEWRYAVIKITDISAVLTLPRKIIVPYNQKVYHFWNATAKTLILTRLGGTGISVAAGKKAVLFFDGNDIVRFSADV